MKFRLVIDAEKEEEVLVTAREKTPLIDEIEALVSRGAGSNVIVGHDEQGVKLLELAEVEAFFIEGGRTYAVCTDGKRCRVKKPLHELESMLPSNFCRINKSNLANLKHLTRLHTSLNGAVDAVFKSGFSDYVSRRCFAELKRRFSI